MIRTAVHLAAAGAAIATLAACEIRVARDEDRRPIDVDIETPLGDLSVTKDATPEDVGVDVYPGARPLAEGDDPERANVWLNSPFIDLQVSALKFTSDAQPDAIAEFYRGQLAKYGSVTVCRGDLDFESDARPPRCSRRRGKGQVQIGVGHERDFRLASVKPRGAGSEFAVVHVRASNAL